jgi:hypothetical protein
MVKIKLWFSCILCIVSLIYYSDILFIIFGLIYFPVVWYLKCETLLH